MRIAIHRDKDFTITSRKSFNIYHPLKKKKTIYTINHIYIYMHSMSTTICHHCTLRVYTWLNYREKLFINWSVHILLFPNNYSSRFCQLYWCTKTKQKDSITYNYKENLYQERYSLCFRELFYSLHIAFFINIIGVLSVKWALDDIVNYKEREKCP